MYAYLWYVATRFHDGAIPQEPYIIGVKVYIFGKASSCCW